MIGLKWIFNIEYPGLFDGIVGDERVAHIQMRPHYCDRGHWHANIDMDLGLDDQDRFPRYYMRLSVAKQEIEEFLDWRINKRRSPEARADLLKMMAADRVDFLLK